MKPQAHQGRSSNHGSARDERAAVYPLMLLVVFVVVWLALALDPLYRQDWWLENVLVIIAVPALACLYRRFRFSNRAYTALFVFLMLHEVGAHYTYSQVPYEDWLQTLTGRTSLAMFGWERNHYDRLVHFCYGLLIALPAFELIDARTTPAGVWRYVLPLTFVWSHSLVYELIEWGAALVFGGELGVAYLGTQGDVWDAQKDVACAALGTVLGMAAIGTRVIAVDAARASATP